MGRRSCLLEGFGCCGMHRKDDPENDSSSSAEKRINRQSIKTSAGKAFSANILRQTEADASWLNSLYAECEREQSKHAIAVAAASAAAADAAVAAAQAAVAVVRLSSNGRGTLFPGGHERLAAVRIQSVFRGYLARKALRALKALVKLQALVRGFLVRKQAVLALRRAPSVVSARSVVGRSRMVERHLRRSLERFEDGLKEQMVSPFSGRRVPTSVDSSSSGHDRSPKIVEVDTCRPYMVSPRIRHYTVEKCRLCLSTAHSTPRRLNLSGTAPGTPVKLALDGFSRKMEYPNYMSSTRSFVAKTRSQSAPRQRQEVAEIARKKATNEVAEMGIWSRIAVRKSCSHIPEAAMFRNAVVKKLLERSTAQLNC
ncbi:hypothetical protein HPP92_022967 [Vanilla planifolia]|uniref:DUF4005 domain-containing protein n=1 Tax=Vanilla planifolia TaxID=51239 RepID=A0A835UE47_VANPL|nr:hypothetical protein HPP92_022967 [Vanilla planifolia]